MLIEATNEAIDNLQTQLHDTFVTALTPAPRLKLSAWVNEHRYLSRESSPEPGKFRWERTPYMREILDVAGDYRVQRLVIMASAQVAKTSLIENVIAWYIANDPAPILVVLPELTTAKAFSTDRLDPMIRDCPVLTHRVREKRTRDSGNTLLQKRFTGGHLTLVGANSASGLRSRPIRVLLLDEVDAFPISAGKEGDPVSLAVARTSNFWNRKIILASTPTVKDLSRIEREFKASDQRYYHVPCPHCGEYDRLTWARVRWENNDPSTAFVVCEKNGCVIQEHEKMPMLRAGKWIAEHPESSVAGFHLNALYSPWLTWQEIVGKWLEAKKNPDTLKVFLNTVLGETWDDAGERVDVHHLAGRLEKWEPKTVPNGVGVLVAGVDVQANWIEGYIWGFGHGEESWLIDRFQIFKDPGTEAAWEDLRVTLMEKYTTTSGDLLGLSAVAIDTGHQSETVFRFVYEMKRRYRWHILPVKGATSPDAPLLRKTDKVFSVGTNTAKDLIHSRLKSVQHGPGCIHLPEWIDVEVLDQLTAERRILRYKSGRPFRVWENPLKKRNEALDCLVYSLAALQSLGPHIKASLAKMANKFAMQTSAPESDVSEVASTSDSESLAATVEPSVAVRKRKRLRRRSGNGWMSGLGY